MTEIPPYRMVEGAVDSEEVTGEFSMSVAGIISSSRSHLFEIDRDLEKQKEGDKDTKNYLDQGSGADVERAIDNLIERSQILFTCIRPNSDQQSLANFSQDLKIRTETMEKVMEDVARSKLMLARMIYRFGLAAQIKLDKEQLIAPGLKLELKELDEAIRDLLEG